MRHDAQQQVGVRQEHGDAERAHPWRLDVGQAQRSLENQQDRERPEDQEDVERHAVAPARPLHHDEDGQQDDGALR